MVTLASSDRSPRDLVADPAPQRAGVDQRRLARRAGTRGQNTQRPNSTSVNGQHDQRREGRDHHAHRAGQPEPARGREHREQQDQQADHDGGGAGQHRLDGTTHRGPHRGVPVVDASQLVAVAGDQQQGVVRAGAEHQHRQDADRRLVPGHAEEVEDLGGQHGGGPVGQADHDERDDPQHRAAVGQDQQDRHHERGRAEQPEVGALEDRGQVGLDRRRPGDLGRDAVRDVGVQGLAQVADGLGDLGRARALDRDDPDRRGAVLAGHERGGRVARSPPAPEPRPVRPPTRPPAGTRRARPTRPDRSDPRPADSAPADGSAKSPRHLGEEVLGRGQLRLAQRRVGGEQHDRDAVVALRERLQGRRDLGARVAVGQRVGRGRLPLGLPQPDDRGEGEEQSDNGHDPGAPSP